jgi:recombination protein RecR
MAAQIGPEIDRLIQVLARLPGLGPRSARRVALHLIKNRDKLMQPLNDALGVALERIVVCDTCGNIDSKSPCSICLDPRRDRTQLCVVEDVADLWALERAEAFKGSYHVLGGVLSPLNGVGPEDLHLGNIKQRVETEGVSEVLLATSATVDGQTTAHYVTDLVQGLGINVSRLAHGVPVGGELDYLDEGTLVAAVRSRQPF